MQESELLQYANNMLMLVLILSLPSILAASIIGTVVSIVQGLTQIQEQTFSFTAKLVAVIATLYLTSGWYGKEIYNFSMAILNQITKVAGSGS